MLTVATDVQVGFYMSKWTKNYNGNGHPLMILATEVPKRFSDNKVVTYRVLRPNQCTVNIFQEWALRDKYELCPTEEVRGDRVGSGWKGCDSILVSFVSLTLNVRLDA